jgi:hypothetical protein
MKRRSLFLHCCDDALLDRQTTYFLDCVHRTFLYKINEFHYIFFLVSVCCKFFFWLPPLIFFYFFFIYIYIYIYIYIILYIYIFFLYILYIHTYIYTYIHTDIYIYIIIFWFLSLYRKFKKRKNKRWISYVLYHRSIT